MERTGVRMIVLFLGLSLISLIFYLPLSILFLSLSIFTAFFFRDPEREIGDGVVSPADGRIDYLSENRLEIFMGLLDCHVNRSPCDGVVEKIEYIPGRFMPAFLKGIRNETNRIWIRSADGVFVVEQIAGFLARRIICFVREGESIMKGQRIGMIVFGSRVTLQIPENYRFVVEKGEKIKAGETVAIKDEKTP